MRLGFFAGLDSTKKYASGVIIAGLIYRSIKNAPINELMTASLVCGNFFFARDLICRQIHLIPNGMLLIDPTIVFSNPFAKSIKILTRKNIE